MRLPATIIIPVTKETIPSPPSWISMRMTILPKRLQWVAVFTTTSPVTQTEVVDVNRASINGVKFPSAEENGRQSIKAPIKIVPRKPSAIIWVVESSLFKVWNIQTSLSQIAKIQFIVSSHAPAVINSVRKEQIRILDNGEIYMPAAQTYGRDANSILREVMKVSERPADIKRRMDLFYVYMDENNYEEADNVLTEIEAIVGTTDPDIAAARTSLDLEKILGE